MEKDSAYHHLRQLKNLLNITVLSGSGVSKTACSEAMIRNLSGLDYTIFTVTDYDPSGFFIGKEAAEKFEILGLSVEAVHRIAVSPDQLDGGILDSQMYPVKMVHNGHEWCEKYGIGPGKKYGFEIEAVSGQPGGAQVLREIVLEAMLDHLSERDRIWEIVGPHWEGVPEDTMHKVLDDFTIEWWRYYRDPHQEAKPISLNEFVDVDEYEEQTEKLEEEKEEICGPIQEDVWTVEREIESVTDTYDGSISNVYASYKMRISELYRKYILPLEIERDERITELRDEKGSKLVPWEAEESALRRQLREAELPFEGQLDYLNNEFRKSRALIARANMAWLKDNINKYIDLGRTVEDLSFGLLPGCHMSACKKGYDVNFLINKMYHFDVERVRSYIASDMENVDIANEIGDKIVELVTQALGEQI